ncbi:MAG: hypothetical protein UFD80_06640 [Blautia sp.]|uniref:hypothetical protein n=1 Tax=Blautia sp. TaxID=1955243 RepID=UPI002E774C3A|nr:hypothetical protein [Blautia sp.]MED9882325.1 hypothetical protein [Blautia sp.]
MDAQQELFTRLLTDLRSKGYDVYDGFLPSEDTPYPFIYLSDSRQTDRMTKTNLTGIVYQTIDVWGNSPKNRGTISNILQDIKRVCFGIDRTSNHVWHVSGVSQSILHDNTTNIPLIHGILQVDFSFS